MTDDLVGRQTVHVRDNLDAYYYGFEPTGNADVDRILGAVAWAGKSYHHTEDWDETAITGVSCVDNIQNAAALAAARIEALEAENERLRETLDVIAMHPGPNADDACWSRVEDARAALTPEAPHAD
ncbi:hypothetical protein [Sphingomonas sp. T9W2]|uniref:hypothetical protein n=1 Tax=Sphingomonas sp. T9W2 TaxID=3143183 RepID=UPI0031F54B99